ncbi:hypothetical protein QR680_006809 [Steinernema hermaphroditum]|uniref:Uncharacterized protein n=1 Tax=Steinernema hermaphroditum TaxID=289476 RepID=A0AA39HY60_9BILA|nr:hypothetical protein QR680_006809 [Steinernema hermaphroditum]
MKEVGCHWDELDDREFGIDSIDVVKDPNLKKMKQELASKGVSQNDPEAMRVAIAEALEQQRELVDELRRVADDVFVFSTEEETRTRSISLAIPNENEEVENNDFGGDEPQGHDDLDM